MLSDKQNIVSDFSHQCDSHSFTLEQALHFIHSRAGSTSSAGGNASTPCDKGREGPAHETDVIDVGTVVGLIAGLPSGVTISLATLMRLFHMPQVLSTELSNFTVVLPRTHCLVKAPLAMA